MRSLAGAKGSRLRTEFCVQHSGGRGKREARSGPESTVSAQGAEIPLCQMQRSRSGGGQGEPDCREAGPLGAEDVESKGVCPLENPASNRMYSYALATVTKYHPVA